MPSGREVMAIAMLAERARRKRYFCPNPGCPLRHGFSGQVAKLEFLREFWWVKVHVFCPECGRLVDTDVEVVGP